MSDTELKPCPECGGEVELYSSCNPNRPYSAFARCMVCKREYPLPTVKLKVWKSNPIRISKSMIHDAEIAWNRRVNQHE